MRTWVNSPFKKMIFLLYCSGELPALVHVAAIPQPHRGPLCQGAYQTWLKSAVQRNFKNLTYKAYSKAFFHLMGLLA